MSSNNDKHIEFIVSRNGEWKKVSFPILTRFMRRLDEWTDALYKEQMDAVRTAFIELKTWVKELDALVKQLKRDFKAKRILQVTAVLYDINILLNKINENPDIKNLHELREKALQEIERTASLSNKDIEIMKALGFNHDMQKTAGWWSDWTRRRIYDKMVEKKRRERDRSINSIIVKLDRTVSSIKETLSLMKVDRNKGEIGSFIDNLNKISLKQKEFQKEYSNIMSTVLKDQAKEINEMMQEATHGKIPSGSGIDETRDLVEQQTQMLPQGAQGLPGTQVLPQEGAQVLPGTQMLPQDQFTEVSPDDVDLELLSQQGQEKLEGFKSEPQLPSNMPEPKISPSSQPAQELPMVPPIAGLTQKLEEGTQKLEEPAPQTTRSPGVLAQEKVNASFLSILTKLAEEKNYTAMVKEILKKSQELDDLGQVETSLKLLSIIDGK
jgi:hypothetical protein